MTETRRMILKDLLWMLAAAGAVAAVLRFAFGLGASTGLNDGTPWGLWIAFKLGFVAMAGGGFTLAAMVHIFHLESYRPILRRAVMLALLGYGSFIVSLIFDLGLPWHIYMPVIHWQPHSVMFEVAWCVMLYFSVLLLEFGPVVLEHPWFRWSGFARLRDFLKRLTVPLVIAGAVLSTLHQSSLGSLFLIMPHRVHPLWYSPWLPVLFFLSAIAAGALVLVLENRFAQVFFARGREPRLSRRLGKLAGFALWLYLALRLGDLAWRGVLPQALDGSWQSQLFLVEVLVGGVLPAVLLSWPRARRRRDVLLTAAGLGLGGVLSQRMALSLFAMQRPLGVPYRPTLPEVLIAVGIPAAALLLYLFFMENLRVIGPAKAPEPLPVAAPPLAGIPLPQGFAFTLRRRSGLAVLALAALAAGLPGKGTAEVWLGASEVSPARGWEILRIDGNRQRYVVDFPHQAHQEALQQEQGLSQAEACRTCHHAAPPGDLATACAGCHRRYDAPSRIFDHLRHQQALGGNAACAECHTQGHSAEGVKACAACHTDWQHLGPAASSLPSGMAPSYLAAMHGRCLSCHDQQAANLARPELSACSTCHAASPEILAGALSQLAFP